jgi:hypothetical protein
MQCLKKNDKFKKTKLKTRMNGDDGCEDIVKKGKGVPVVN